MQRQLHLIPSPNAAARVYLRPKSKVYKKAIGQQELFLMNILKNKHKISVNRLTCVGLLSIKKGVVNSIPTWRVKWWSINQMAIRLCDNYRLDNKLPPLTYSRKWLKEIKRHTSHWLWLESSWNRIDKNSALKYVHYARTRKTLLWDFLILNLIWLYNNDKFPCLLVYSSATMPL